MPTIEMPRLVKVKVSWDEIVALEGSDLRTVREIGARLRAAYESAGSPASEFTRDQLIAAARSLSSAPANATVYAPGDAVPERLQQMAQQPGGWLIRSSDWLYQNFQDGDVVLRALVLRSLGAFEEKK